MKIRTIIAATCAALAFSIAGAVSAHEGEAETVTKNFEAAIPNIPGKSLIALEVNYAPGAASPSHTHAKSAFIYAYVISGAIESKVNDGETRIYRAGESWSEAPGATHSISRNASKTEPAKLLAVFVLDINDNPLTTPIRQILQTHEDMQQKSRGSVAADARTVPCHPARRHGATVSERIPG
jgi:quercetin dioxygenase-like cupin family protein